jgi:hypothetical protein
MVATARSLYNASSFDDALAADKRLEEEFEYILSSTEEERNDNQDAGRYGE